MVAPGCHPVGCSMYLTVKDGKVVSVEGDPEHPITKGRLCPRCIALDEVLYHPDRILHPMVRDPKDRGLDKWREVTWDEAYDIIEKKVRQIWEESGPQAMFTLQGTGRQICLYAAAYAHALLASPNYSNVQSGQACYGPRCTIANYQLGAGYPEIDYAAFFPDRYDDPRYELPKYMILWGKEPLNSNPDGFFGGVLIDMMKRGTKLIVIDPRLTWEASRAEYHLQLRPGTDTALGLALCNVIITEDLYDHEFVEKWCYGFDEFAATCAEWTPERAAEVCWVDADLIRGAARTFATCRPSTAGWGLAVDTIKNGTQAGMVFLSLVALCGYLDVPGGVTLAEPSSFMGKWRFETANSVPEEAKANRVYDLEGKYSCYFSGGAMPGIQPDSLLAWLELEDPPTKLRMSWWCGTNPIACMSADPERWEKALKGVEFNVTNDYFMNPSIMSCADVVLPLSMFCEQDAMVLPHYGRNTHFVGALNPVVENDDTKSDVEIFIELGRRLRPEVFPWKNADEFFTEMLHTKFDWGFEQLQDEVIHQMPFEYKKYESGKLRADGQPGFDTPTGLVELKSSIYPLFGEQALPYYEEPDLSPYSDVIPEDIKEKYPLVLTSGGRNVVYFHSEHRQVPSLRSKRPWPTVTIHPDTAAKYGIEEGDWVALENPIGRCVQKASLRETLDPRVIHAEHGWWFPEQEGEAPNLFGTYKANSCNLVPNDSVGVTGYGAPYKNVICSITKVDSLDG